MVKNAFRPPTNRKTGKHLYQMLACPTRFNTNLLNPETLCYQINNYFNVIFIIVKMCYEILINVFSSFMTTNIYNDNTSS